MNRLKLATKWTIAMTGLLAAASAQAQQSDRFEPAQYEGLVDSKSLPATIVMPDRADRAALINLPLTSHSALYGSASPMKRYAGAGAGRWLNPDTAASKQVAVGYAWRKVELEGSASTEVEPDRYRPDAESFRLKARSGRLSFKPSPNWSLQFSRRHVSNVDEFDPEGMVRRTTIAATYHRAFSQADMQTTLAWGRNARKYRETTMGYLFESTLRVFQAHSFFGQIEQVGSDQLLRVDESIDRRMFKMNKITFGYFREIRGAGPIDLDVGGLISRYRVPSAMTAAYGSDPTFYMMFVRLKLD